MATFTVSIKEVKTYMVEVQADTDDKLAAIEAALADRDAWSDESWDSEGEDTYIAREHRYREDGEEYNYMSDFIIYSEADLATARKNGGLE